MALLAQHEFWKSVSERWQSKSFCVAAVINFWLARDKIIENCGGGLSKLKYWFSGESFASARNLSPLCCAQSLLSVHTCWPVIFLFERAFRIGGRITHSLYAALCVLSIRTNQKQANESKSSIYCFWLSLHGGKISHSHSDLTDIERPYNAIAHQSPLNRSK